MATSLEMKNLQDMTEQISPRRMRSRQGLETLKVLVGGAMVVVVVVGASRDGIVWLGGWMVLVMRDVLLLSWWWWVELDVSMTLSKSVGVGAGETGWIIE